MIEASASPSGSRSQHWPGLALVGVVVAYFAMNVATSRIHFHSDYLEAVMVGIMVFEPMSFGIWSALATGPLITRLPMALLSLSILLVSTGLVDRDGFERDEFIFLAISGMAISIFTTLLFLAVRWWTGCRIEYPQSDRHTERRRVRFSIKHLLTVTTLLAVTLGMLSQLKFREPIPGGWFPAPEFAFYVFVVGGAMVAALSLPTIAVPWFLLSRHVSKRAIGFAIAFWSLITFLGILIWTMNEADRLPQLAGSILLVQLGAALAGALAALPLRLAGLRLVRGRSDGPQPLTANSIPSQE